MRETRPGNNILTNTKAVCFFTEGLQLSEVHFANVMRLRPPLELQGRRKRFTQSVCCFNSDIVFGYSNQFLHKSYRIFNMLYHLETKNIIEHIILERKILSV